MKRIVDFQGRVWKDLSLIWLSVISYLIPEPVYM